MEVNNPILFLSHLSGIVNTPGVATSRQRTVFEYETVASLVRCLKAYEEKLIGDPDKFMRDLDELQ